MVPNRYHFVFGLKRHPQPFHLVHYLCLASCIGVNARAALFTPEQFMNGLCAVVEEMAGGAGRI